MKYCFSCSASDKYLLANNLKNVGKFKNSTIYPLHSKCLPQITIWAQYSIEINNFRSISMVANDHKLHKVVETDKLFMIHSSVCWLDTAIICSLRYFAGDRISYIFTVEMVLVLLL